MVVAKRHVVAIEGTFGEVVVTFNHHGIVALRNDCAVPDSFHGVSLTKLRAVVALCYPQFKKQPVEIAVGQSTVGSRQAQVFAFNNHFRANWHSS